MVFTNLFERNWNLRKRRRGNRNYNLQTPCFPTKTQDFNQIVTPFVIQKADICLILGPLLKTSKLASVSVNRHFSHNFDSQHQVVD